MSALPEHETCYAQASYCKFGSDILQQLFLTLKEQIGGVAESEEIEYVHKMRVATRRIRATMPLFQDCFPKKKFKKWLREIKNVTQLLGDARDLDVQIAFMQKYMLEKSTETNSVGLAILDKYQKNRRRAAQATVSEGLKELLDSGMLEKIDQLLRENSEKLATAPFDQLLVIEKASRHLSSRLDDFLSLETCVQQEKAIDKHHQMRIRAKMLRYTMEAFASLYETQLVNEIQTMKSFQDILGEMHDLDVWINFLPKFIVKVKSYKIEGNRRGKTVTAAQIRRSVLNFLMYVKKMKKTLYEQFVESWKQKKTDGFFDRLRETASGETKQGKAKINQALSKPNVKIAVMSDIHANIHALEAVIRDAEGRGADIILNAGDLVGFGAFPNEVIELLHAKNVVSILGNFDCEVLRGPPGKEGAKEIAVKFARKELSKSCESYLASLPAEVSLQVAGLKLLMVHGSLESMNDHIYSDTPVARLNELAEETDANIVIVGHSHQQFYRQSVVSFLNPGSVGRPGDGNPQTGYALISFTPFRVDLIRLFYDVEAAAEGLRKKNLPESFSQMLLLGVPLEVVIQEDEARKDDTKTNCENVFKACNKVSHDYCSDAKHIEQIVKLASVFFDGLRPVHHLGRRERCWLKCAAALHDVGLSESLKGHHKKSMRIILNETRLPFTSEERKVIASIARYHRKGPPKRNHHNLATLSYKTIQKIVVLSSLLRIADALDYSHQSIVSGVEIKCNPTRTTVAYFSSSKSRPEEEAFNKKRDLFENVFRKKLVLKWMHQ